MKTIATLSSLSWLVGALAQSTASTSPWEYGKDISFAGLVWFLVGYLIPRLLQSAKEDRDTSMTAIATLGKDHATAMNAIAEVSRESSRSGHEAAEALAAEIRSMKEKLIS